MLHHCTATSKLAVTNDYNTGDKLQYHGNQTQTQPHNIPSHTNSNNAKKTPALLLNGNHGNAEERGGNSSDGDNTTPRLYAASSTSTASRLPGLSIPVGDADDTSPHCMLTHIPNIQCPSEHSASENSSQNLQQTRDSSQNLKKSVQSSVQHNSDFANCSSQNIDLICSHQNLDSNRLRIENSYQNSHDNDDDPRQQKHPDKRDKLPNGPSQCNNCNASSQHQSCENGQCKTESSETKQSGINEANFQGGSKALKPLDNEQNKKQLQNNNKRLCANQQHNGGQNINSKSDTNKKGEIQQNQQIHLTSLNGSSSEMNGHNTSQNGRTTTNATTTAFTSATGKSSACNLSNSRVAVVNGHKPEALINGALYGQQEMAPTVGAVTEKEQNKSFVEEEIFSSINETGVKCNGYSQEEISSWGPDDDGYLQQKKIQDCSCNGYSQAEMSSCVNNGYAQSSEGKEAPQQDWLKEKGNASQEKSLQANQGETSQVNAKREKSLEVNHEANAKQGIPSITKHHGDSKAGLGNDSSSYSSDSMTSLIKHQHQSLSRSGPQGKPHCVRIPIESSIIKDTQNSEPGNKALKNVQNEIDKKNFVPTNQCKDEIQNEENEEEIGSVSCDNGSLIEDKEKSAALNVCEGKEKTARCNDQSMQQNPDKRVSCDGAKWAALKESGNQGNAADYEDSSQVASLTSPVCCHRRPPNYSVCSTNGGECSSGGVGEDGAECAKTGGACSVRKKSLNLVVTQASVHATEHAHGDQDGDTKKQNGANEEKDPTYDIARKNEIKKMQNSHDDLHSEDNLLQKQKDLNSSETIKIPSGINKNSVNKCSHHEHKNLYKISGDLTSYDWTLIEDSESKQSSALQFILDHFGSNEKAKDHSISLKSTAYTKQNDVTSGGDDDDIDAESTSSTETELCDSDSPHFSDDESDESTDTDDVTIFSAPRRFLRHTLRGWRQKAAASSERRKYPPVTVYFPESRSLDQISSYQYESLHDVQTRRSGDRNNNTNEPRRPDYNPSAKQTLSSSKSLPLGSILDNTSAKTADTDGAKTDSNKSLTSRLANFLGLSFDGAIPEEENDEYMRPRASTFSGMTSSIWPPSMMTSSAQNHDVSWGNQYAAGAWTLRQPSRLYAAAREGVDDSFTHVHAWFEEQGARACSRTEKFFLHGYRSEEPAQTNMDISTGHIVLAYMEDHLANKARLDEEWEGLEAYEAEPNATTVAEESANARKNRYQDMLPFDHSRVVLNPETNVSGSDYINASSIMDHDPRNPAYIATQGPLPHTVADFWQMVWEQGSVVIVNLTNLTENGTAMCHRYWPEEGSDLYHIYEVHLVSEHIWCEDYLVRSFYLKNLQTHETRTVTQFHFTSWPDLGVPASIKVLLDFRRKVNKSYRGRSCPIVIHCSDAVGRTGAYCLIDMVLNRMSKGAKEIDIAATLEHIRDQRMGMVKTKAQFELALASVAEEVTSILKALPQS